MSSIEDHEAVAAATAGDEQAFGLLTQRYRRELHVHCYRMLGSYDEAEDLVQETFLRAWHKRATFEGGPGFRAWLYRIATNTCLDALRRSSRQVPVLHSFAEVPWLQPYPDRLLDEIAPEGIAQPEAQPEAVVVAKETIELAFLAAIQLLPPQQRAVLILRDVLGWTASDTASLLGTTVPAANSALQRARVTMRGQLPPRRLDWPVPDPSDDEQALLQRYIDAHERSDAAAMAELMHHDVRATMPPEPLRYDGRDALAPLFEAAFGPATGHGATGRGGMGRWRLVPTHANRMPAAASYLRRPGDSEYRAFKLDVLRIAGGAIAETTTFDARMFAAFGLPPTL